MFRILESQAPAKQTASDTISTLSGRLQSATLLEDRRAAILGLRSFAKLYPASVASGALRSLINSLSSDGEDVETIKVVLETLLMLFNPDESSPEASDDIALWLADEFTQRQENITVLLDLLDRNEFFSRLYSLQLISAISSARLSRTQECVYTAPLGVSKLVAVLDDKREAIRSEGLILLVALTPASQELQKLIAFENAFDKIFAIIELDGSLCHGGITVQDCLALLANLLRLNTSNQSFFRETGGVLKVADLLRKYIADATTRQDLPEWTTDQKDKNIWGTMSVIRLFLTGGSVGTQMNQNAFWQSHVTFYVLDLAFSEAIPTAVRSEAFYTCADLIKYNGTLQELFGQREVHVYIPTTEHNIERGVDVNGRLNPSQAVSMNVIQGLLDMALAVSIQASFEIRLAACECIKAYLNGHISIRSHFLRRAKEGYFVADPEPDNVFTILLDGGNTSSVHDPYRKWIASIILFYLIQDDHGAKKMAMDIVEGDAEKGEEVVTCIQMMSGSLVASTQRDGNDRTTIGYLMILTTWLFEDPDAVNDFLQEGSNVQSLIQLTLQTHQAKAIEAGLCAFLLGIVYEYSTKDSPISRVKLHDILGSNLGRDQYNDRLSKLREHPFVRDFEVLFLQDRGNRPHDTYFDKGFVDFLKDNFSRISRAIDRDPGMEIPVLANGVQKGISRDLVDSLRSQLEDKVHNLQKVESEVLTLERKLALEQADHRKTKDSAAIETERIKSINAGLQRHHVDESDRIEEEHQRALACMKRDHATAIAAFEARIRKIEEQCSIDMEKLRSRHRTELEDFKSATSGLEKDLEKANNDHTQDLRMAHEEYTSKTKVLENRLGMAEEKAREAERQIAIAESRTTSAQNLAKEHEGARANVQTELDDLLMVLADLEEKRSRDKARLKDLGEEVSDGGEDEDEEEEDEDEDEDNI